MGRESQNSVILLHLLRNLECKINVQQTEKMEEAQLKIILAVIFSESIPL